jgi:hypothetical protein
VDKSKKAKTILDYASYLKNQGFSFVPEKDSVRIDIYWGNNRTIKLFIYKTSNSKKIIATCNSVRSLLAGEPEGVINFFLEEVKLYKTEIETDTT